MIYILLPCYNELENLKKIIKKTNKLSSIGSNKIKIIIVNDGSSDQTKNYIIKLKKNLIVKFYI
jgi:glycosyltransferase involved in cell wall biosynthesis